MLRVSRAANGKVVFTVSGRLSGDNLGELQGQIELEAADRLIVLDLKDLTLVDRAAVSFLRDCKAGGIELRNCPAFISEWIARETVEEHAG